MVVGYHHFRKHPYQSIFPSLFQASQLFRLKKISPGLSKSPHDSRAWTGTKFLGIFFFVWQEVDDGKRGKTNPWNVENGWKWYDPWRWVVCHDFVVILLDFCWPPETFWVLTSQNFGPWFFGTSLRLLELKSAKNHGGKLLQIQPGKVSQTFFSSVWKLFEPPGFVLFSVCWQSMQIPKSNALYKTLKDDVTLYMCQANELKLSQIYP